MGCLPLGLELVGRYLAQKPDLSLEKLRQRLEDKRLEAKALKEAHPEMTATLGVAAAFELSWQELDGKAQQGVAMLLSLFALAEIPWELVQACLTLDEEDLEDLWDQQLLKVSICWSARKTALINSINCCESSLRRSWSQWILQMP